MGFLDKVKNMFIEELGEEDVIKKEVIQVKIPQPEEVKKEKVESKPIPKPVVKQEKPAPSKHVPKIFEDEEEEEIVKEEVVRPEPEEIKPVKQPLPTFFDDSDFEMIDKPVVKAEPAATIKQEYKYTRTETVVTPVITGYNGKKNEDTKKVFQPTPIISPVYGVLDKNYRKDEIRPKKKTRPATIYTEFDNISVDDIRNKAFGSLEDELASNLVSKNPITFNDDLFSDDIIDNNEIGYDEQPIDIFGELEKKDALDDLLNAYEIKDESIYKDEKPETGLLVEEELNRNYDNFEEELNKSYTKELNDADLFNLIDSMYDKKDGE